jgi:hypothetical protein
MLCARVRWNRQRLFALLALLPLVGANGCGSGRYPVAGKVVWADGTPAKELVGGMVICESTGVPVGARGEIKEDGSFQLVTERPGDGATPGRYRVLISQPRPDDSLRPRPPLPMDTRFEDFKTSGLEFTVEPRRNEPVLKVQRNTKKGAR